MRLEELYLDGFGRFHQQTIGVSEPVTVFYGPNEAGKSTLLAFVRAILFGFPTRGRTEHYPPLAGGRHGGRIRFSDDAGAVYTLERFAGARGGAASLLTGAGESLDVATTLPRLTGQATPDLFRNVFAFSLDELQSEGLMKDAGIADRIYSAGLGVSNLPDFARALSERKRKLFLPGGSAQKIAESLRGLASVDQQLQAVLGNADEYRRLVNRQDEISQELAGADAELSRLNARRAEIAGLQTGWDGWLALTDCETRLGEMPRFEQFPENPIHAWKAWKNERGRAMRTWQMRPSRSGLPRKMPPSKYRAKTCSTTQAVSNTFGAPAAVSTVRSTICRSGRRKCVGSKPFLTKTWRNSATDGAKPNCKPSTRRSLSAIRCSAGNSSYPTVWMVPNRPNFGWSRAVWPLKVCKRKRGKPWRSCLRSRRRWTLLR